MTTRARTFFSLLSLSATFACGSHPGSSSGSEPNAAGGSTTPPSASTTGLPIGGGTGRASSSDEFATGASSGQTRKRSGSGGSFGTLHTEQTGGSGPTPMTSAQLSGADTSLGGATNGEGSSGRGAGASSQVAGGGSANSATSGGAPTSLPKFILGADISSVDEAIDRGSQFADVDGTSMTIFGVLKRHGFNFIRLRAFVDPGAKYGYAYGTGGSCIKTETYCDTDHTVAFAKQAKNEGLGLLLDLHYSDTWCDPGNQIIPEAWRNAANIGELAAQVKAYTRDIVSKLSDAGALPEIVQIGNETTPGMLIHIPTSNTDCWGNNVSAAPLGGSTSNWANLGTLLKAGIEGAKSVSSSIRTMVHIENTESASGVVDWIRKAKGQGVTMDIVGLSCYVAFQGEPSVWKNTFSTLATTFSDLSFVIAEYNPERTQANQIMHDLPNGRGLGTFLWEPTQGGEWGSSLFTWSGKTAQANAVDFQEFDSIAASVGLK